MNMIEKVARAMIAKHYGPEGSEEFEKILRNFGDTYLESAAAAIEAMREPTEAMVDAGIEAKAKLYETMEKEGKDTRTMLVAEHPAGTIYVAMIDKALSPE